MNAYQQRQHQRLEFALKLAFESGKLYQQAQDSTSPRFSDQRHAESNHEFSRAETIIREVIGSASVIGSEASGLAGQERVAQKKTRNLIPMTHRRSR